MESQITTKKLRKVRSNLPNGAMEVIAEQLKISVSTVSNVFLGNNKKQLNEVLKKALLIIEEDKKAKADLLKKIDEL
ncbi:hypothetical protein GCM10009120_18460 [Sphingobacterium siyangense subsp. cladoniae]|uniref:hypothetical protein n=1 Tax=Sphingobacterium siyangense TaxID=459529 RepID=UPI0031F739A2